ncbi:hypothetical protein [Tychonema bourrellyi]|uniref:hypothetical protein n=1 Tax=Tychonema bourrellyi TaxID=54313 RepID=UPI0015D4B58F|nr:hypothetical protein [Tychonema bourrellyi]
MGNWELGIGHWALGIFVPSPTLPLSHSPTLPLSHSLLFVSLNAIAKILDS